MNRSIRILLSVAGVMLISAVASGADRPARIPGEVWLKYATPGDAGFSSEKLAEARAYFDSIPASAVFVVYKGAVLVDWGETTRRFRCHSARKSLMSALYGIHIENGGIDTSKTMEALGIDDNPVPLTPEEKTARIVDLLSARSGVYHLAAYEPPQNPKPERGAYPPGTNWCYNNWDFNTLLTILEQETGVKVFEEFNKRFAVPLQMQDYHPSHGYYHYEPDKSIHPAYPFRMSARDMARFGLLYLHGGRWGDNRILSEAYVAKSVSRISTGTWTGGYGYMWWLFDDEPFKSLGMFSALGVGQQSIDVIPGADMVFVLRTNTYRADQVTGEQRLDLIRKILEARTGESKVSPQLVAMVDPAPEYVPQPIAVEEMTPYIRDYPVGDGSRSISVLRDDGRLKIDFGEGAIALHRLGPDHFIVEDFNEHVFFEEDSLGRKQIIAADLLLFEAYTIFASNDVDGALAVMHKALQYYPDNPQVFEALTEMHLSRAAEAVTLAIENYRHVCELTPAKALGQGPIAWWLAGIQGEVAPPEISPDRLGLLAGKYGPRTVELDDGDLYYVREGRPERRKLIALTESIFAVEGIDYFRIRFDADESGRIYGLTGMYADGRRDESRRDP